MPTSKNKQTVVMAAGASDRNVAQHLAEELQLSPIAAEQSAYYDWVLICDGDKLSLRFPGASKPFAVDFTQPAYLRRLQSATCVREPLARAVGLKSGSRLRVVDGTAGWGTDSLLLATLGAQVTSIERSPIVAALLANGLKRARQLPLLAQAVVDLRVTTTQTFLADLPPDCTVLYLDPMFPSRPNNARVKKPLQLLQMLLGENPLDAEQLAIAALQSNCKRVVIKRPTWAEPLVKTPNFSVPAGGIRFDGYLLT